MSRTQNNIFDDYSITTLDQSCDTTNTSCPFSRWMDLKTNLDICDIVFQVPADEVYRRVQFTNAYYGADQPRGTRIVFVNGRKILEFWKSFLKHTCMGVSDSSVFDGILT